MVELYRSNGWDFSFTEHEFYSYWQELSSDDFLVLPGIEMGLISPVWALSPSLGHTQSGNGAKHLVKPRPPKEMAWLELRGNLPLRKEGYLTIYRHPCGPG